MDYSDRSYGRNDEIARLFRAFGADHDVSMPGPRRLGKTFVLERLVDAAPDRGWMAVKVDLAGCTDRESAFRELCTETSRVLFDERRQLPKRLGTWLSQRAGQLLGSSKGSFGGSWYDPLTRLDVETYFRRLVHIMDDAPERRCVLLVDELPIFLKALHDRGPDGISDARDFMNLVSRLRERHKRVRWMITGSVGIEPLARKGDYAGVLAKFRPFELKPLNETQSVALIKDLAAKGRFMHREAITDIEARLLTKTVGWCAPFYLEALAAEMRDEPETDPVLADRAVEKAVEHILRHVHTTTFGTWEEQLRKHYDEPERTVAFEVLAALAEEDGGRDLDDLLVSVGRSELTRERLRDLLLRRLCPEGFVAVDDPATDSPTFLFLNPLLRRWWRRYRPQAVE